MIDRRLIHYSAYRLDPKKLRSFDPGNDHLHAGIFKPKGLWVSAEGEDDWPNWCKREEWGLESLRYATQILLWSDARILHLQSASDIDWFTDCYVTPPDYREGFYRREEVNWSRVGASYQGIIISPYVWERRLNGHKDTLWYYGWDCASGCIWDVSAIAKTKNLGRLFSVENLFKRWFPWRTRQKIASLWPSR